MAKVRFIAIGRKNWIFYGNEQGGKVAVFYSLVATSHEGGATRLRLANDG